jgi:hypothetical protein
MIPSRLFAADEQPVRDFAGRMQDHGLAFLHP